MKLIVDIKKKLGDFHLNAAFEADDGVLGLLGASGSGKSMTLKCIAGIEKPDSGYIELDGNVLFDSRKGIDLPPQRRSVGYLFQSYALFPHMTVRQNIQCGLHGIRERGKRASVEQEMIRFMKLNGLENHRPSQLSGGQQQRLALARMLASSPKLLMLDEPFSALDSHLREKLQIDLKALLGQYHAPTLMVTHSRDEAYRICQRIALMEHGYLYAPVLTKKLFADPGTVAAAAMTGCKNITAAHKTGEHEVFAPAWGVGFHTAAPVRDDLCAIGLRAHYFNTRTQPNRHAVRLGEVIEEPFELIVPFRYTAQQADAPVLWWRLPKERRPSGDTAELGIAPDNVLLLYPQEGH